jgi:2-polyprenyl-6-methoxyphenol hydroxylase-like FAD-dependent oxidoreductase
MSPFAGLGVNLAFEDAMRLADAITKTAKVSKSGATTEARVALDKNVLEFERDMCQRATRAQQLTFNAMTLFFFRPGAPGSAIEQIVLQRMQFMCTGWQTPLFRLLYPFLWATVYAGYGIYKAFGLRR